MKLSADWRSMRNSGARSSSSWNPLLSAPPMAAQSGTSSSKKVVTTPRTPLRPQMVVRTLSDLLPDDAVISLDCGAKAHGPASLSPEGGPLR
jgi:hypothetical protein